MSSHCVCDDMNCIKYNLYGEHENVSKYKEINTAARALHMNMRQYGLSSISSSE